MEVFVKCCINRPYCFNALKNLSRLEYTSAISIKQLYPNSNVKIETPPEAKITEVAKGKFSGHIPIDKLLVTSCHSSGPGGQHANTSNTKVEVRFHVASADWIPQDVRERLTEMKGNELTKDGYLIIRSDKTRAHHLNMADVMQRLRTLIYKAAEKPEEISSESLERLRQRRENANSMRLVQKRLRSDIKRGRKIDDKEY